MRLDSGNDCSDHIDVIRQEQADFLIKRNLRQQSTEVWLDRAKQDGVKSTREGKTVYRGAFEDAPRRGHAPERCVYQVIERTVTADGQILLIPDIEVAAYWRSLTASPDDVLPPQVHPLQRQAHYDELTGVLRAAPFWDHAEQKSNVHW